MFLQYATFGMALFWLGFGVYLARNAESVASKSGTADQVAKRVTFLRRFGIAAILGAIIMFGLQLLGSA